MTVEEQLKALQVDNDAARNMPITAKRNPGVPVVTKNSEGQKIQVIYLDSDWEIIEIKQ